MGDTVRTICCDWVTCHSRYDLHSLSLYKSDAISRAIWKKEIHMGSNLALRGFVLPVHMMLGNIFMIEFERKIGRGRFSFIGAQVTHWYGRAAIDFTSIKRMKFLFFFFWKPGCQYNLRNRLSRYHRPYGNTFLEYLVLHSERIFPLLESYLIPFAFERKGPVGLFEFLCRCSNTSTIKGWFFLKDICQCVFLFFIFFVLFPPLGVWDRNSNDLVYLLTMMMGRYTAC